MKYLFDKKTTPKEFFCLDQVICWKCKCWYARRRNAINYPTFIYNWNKKCRVGCPQWLTNRSWKSGIQYVSITPSRKPTHCPRARWEEHLKHSKPLLEWPEIKDL